MLISLKFKLSKIQNLTILESYQSKYSNHYVIYKFKFIFNLIL